MVVSGEGKKLFIITGDHSGDIHASRVVAALKRQQPNLQIAAVGGENLRSQDIEIVSDQSKMGKVGAGSILSAPYHYFLGQRILKFLNTFRPDAVLLIDYGMFNLWMAEQLKKRGIPVYYFIPPQVWASRRGRIKKIKANVDHVFCIFPFEETLYQSEQIPVTYVGHPLVGELPPATSKNELCVRYGLDPNRPVVGVFAGSRKSEINALLPQLIPALCRLQQQRPDGMPPIQFILAKATSLSDEFFEPLLAAAWEKAFKEYPNDAKTLQQENFKCVTNDNHAVMSGNDALIAKSGTTTLEAALYRKPMILIYKIHPLIYPIALKIAYLPCLGLPNILTDMKKPPVPELWQDHVNPKEITETLLPLLNPHSPESQYQQASFEKIHQLMNIGAAPKNVANALLAKLSS